MEYIIDQILNECTFDDEEESLEESEEELVRRLMDYLQELRDRLENSVRAHHAFTQEAVSIIKEVSRASGKFADQCQSKQPSWIKRLILGFETLSATHNPSVTKDKVLLKEFSRVIENPILGKSQQTCEQARDMLQKVLDKAQAGDSDISDSDTIVNETSSDCVFNEDKIRFAPK